MRQFGRKLCRMGRRGFLETLAGLGVSTAALNGLDKDTFEQFVDDPKKEVPYVYSYVHTNHEAVVESGATPERGPVRTTMPRAQWVRIKAAADARRRVADTLAEIDQPLSAWTTTEADGDKLVEVEVYDDGSLGSKQYDRIEQIVPETIDGVAGRGTDAETVVADIPTTVTRTKTGPATTKQPIDTDLFNDPADHFYDDWNACPAGGGMHVVGYVDGDVKGKVGTTATPVDGNRIICSGHVIGKDFDDPQVTLTNVSEPMMEDEDGDGEKEFQDHYQGYEKLEWSWDPTDTVDAALLNGWDTQYQFATDKGYTTGDIHGSLSKTALQTIADDGTHDDATFTFQGANSGLNDTDFGIIKNKDIAFEINIETVDGDSGGPCYVDWDTNLRAKKFAFPDGAFMSGSSGSYQTQFQNIAGVLHGYSYDDLHASSMHAIESEFKVEV